MINSRNKYKIKMLYKQRCKDMTKFGTSPQNQ